MLRDIRTTFSSLLICAVGRAGGCLLDRHVDHPAAPWFAICLASQRSTQSHSDLSSNGLLTLTAPTCQTSTSTSQTSNVIRSLSIWPPNTDRRRWLGLEPLPSINHVLLWLKSG